MKKTLLLTALVAIAIFSINAQGANKVWNFGSNTTLFPLSSGIGAGPDKSVYVDGLGIHTGTVTNTNMGAITASVKTFTSQSLGELSFANRFQFNGGGYTGSSTADAVPTVNMPTQRYLSIAVGGNSTLYCIGITGSNDSDRKIFVTDGTNLVGTMSFGGRDLMDYTINYTGSATTLYIYCNAACNLYYLSATNVVTSSVNQVLADKGISYNGNEIVNRNKIAIEIYDVLGKRVAASNNNISVTNYDKGVYFVRAAGSKETLKFNR